LDFNPKFVFDTVEVFLQALVSGEKELFYYRGLNVSDQFYITTGKGYEFLLYKVYKHKVEEANDDEGKTIKTENRGYIGQILYYLGDCPGISKNAAQVKYKSSSLINIFRDYYNCIDSEPWYVKTGERVKFEIGFSAGMSVSKIKFINHFPGFDVPQLTKIDFPFIA
jgi:hypothetical protein